MITIGITGHRFILETDLLRAGVFSALKQVDTAFPGEEWQMVSSLAEGADRLVMDCIWQHRPDTRLIVPLPLEVEDYEQDFPDPDSVKDFRRLLQLADKVLTPPPASTRNEAYYLAGISMLAHSNLVLALWDGETARSRGGTGDIVNIARQRELPLAWVHCGNAVSLGENQGEVSFEGFKNNL
ncbi:MAG: hypothetical protein CVU39_20035 [Chloroflexi bacterium HGW-Chloroflexi-10]|nr:MAG: hypothetical protein CVU39_20035 [Chloroflexi bacterium HGW-Chloroflexi-10]